MLVKSLGIISALYMFLVGISGMSSAIKHMGADFAEKVLITTSNPFIALFIGVFATVPVGTERLRFCPTPLHSEDLIYKLIDSLKKVLTLS